MSDYHRPILRRYTPPTCTLNVWAKASPLSQWSDRTLLEALNFELNFDDPRLLDHEQVSIRGNHQELEHLCDLVSDYVQNFLQPQNLEIPSVSLSSHTATLSLPQTLPSLKPKGLLFHQLHWVSLNEPQDPKTIELTASQLFDLSDALESYRHDLPLIPSLYRSHRRKNRILWGSIAAGLLAALSIPTFIIPWYQVQSQKNQLANSENAEESSPDTSFLDVTPPVPPTTQPSVPNLNVPPNLASREQLPPPPATEALSSPSRPQNPPLVAPPKAIVPPPPVVPPAPPQPQSSTSSPPPLQPQQITILPSPSLETPQADSRMREGISPTPSLTLPELPPLANPQAASTVNSPSLPPQTATQTSLLDAIPQVTEVRNYFEQTWQPIPEVKQTLEYRLLIAQDGSIEKITPLGKAATLYQPRTGMPATGQPFVSPLSVDGSQTIRLVLIPNGKVKTFLENRNS